MTDLDTLIQTRIRQDVQSMHAYAIQDATGMVKLDAMENPYALPAELQTALGERLGALALNRYPAGRVNDLRRALAAHANLPAGYDIMLGNGSDELISLLAMAVALPASAPAQIGSAEAAKKPVVMAPVPGFVMYAMSAQLQGLDFVGVPLTSDFELDEAAMLAAIARHDPAVLYLAYPNNPTANLWKREVIVRLIAAMKAQGGMVVMDEAYQPFSSHTWADEIRAAPQLHEHVLLMRTLSKLGLAGVRIGYMLGPQALIAEVDKLRPPYNISVLNCECALFALGYQEVFASQAKDIRAQRAIYFEALKNLSGVTVWPSDANMILVRVPDAKAVFAGMKTRGVLIKNVSGLHPLLANCLRITIGTPGENQRMFEALVASLMGAGTVA